MTQPRILTFNFHEPYLCLMAKTGLQFDVGQYDGGKLARDWQVQFRPKPDNLHLVPEKEWRASAIKGQYDVIIAHNEMNAVDVYAARAAKLLICHNRRSFVIARARSDEGEPVDVFQRLLNRLAGAFDFVFISESKRADYGFPGRVIPPGMDVDEYGGYRGEVSSVLRVGNAMSDRTLMFDVGLQEAVCRDLPHRIVGVNPDISGSEPAPSYEALLECYRGLRCMLHVSREEYEDGYNLAMLEAMACGMPVVALSNRTSPLTDGVDGFLSYDPVVLRERIEQLLIDPDLARRLGERARETVAGKFPIEAFTERWREAIFEAADGAGKPRLRVQAKPKPAPRIRALMQYLSSPTTTGRYFDLAAQPRWDILTAGFRIPEEVLKLWGFEEDPPPYPPHLINLPIKDHYPVLRERLPLDYRGDFFFYVDSGAGQVEPGIELLDMPKIAYLIDVHLLTHTRIAMARHFDVVFLAQKDYVEVFRQAGIPYVFWVPLACWPPLHDVGPFERTLDLAYVGSFSAEEGERRRDLFSRLAERFPNHLIQRCWPREMARIYGRAKIVVNACINRDINMRVFEALASGALLITDEAEGLEDLFEDGKHLVIYRDDEDVFEKVAYYLEHAGERERIAEAGRELVLSKHTYTHRIEAIERLSEDVLGPLHQPERHLKKRASYYEHPRRELLPFIPFRSRSVLDIGCGAGALLNVLKTERKVQEVAGVEIIPEAYEKAKEVLDHAFLGNIEDLELPFEEGHFDCIICADVLEHLVEPEKALRKLAHLLSPEGVLVISVPNAGFYEVLLMLSSGGWGYQEAGILDYTHLRWFTRSSLKEFVAAAGLEAAEIQPLSIAGPEALPRQADGSVRLNKIQLNALSEEEYENLRVYQYLALACKPGRDRLEPARTALASNDNETAVALAADAVGVDPFEQRRIIAKALARIGTLKEAEAYYREALEYREDPEVMGELGTLLIAMNRVGEAKGFVERALAALPDHARVQAAMGLLLMMEGQSEAALERLLFALRDSYDHPALVSHALELARALGRSSEIIELVGGYADFYPGNLDLACAYAALLADAGRIEEARRKLDTVLLFDPAHAGANRILGEIDQAGDTP